MKSLLIYKASAGSGKTFTLVQEYLRLLLKEQDPYRFKRIMAMTFTNKAALEMKERVIDALFQLATQSNEKERKFALNTAENLVLKPEELRERSEKAISAILHNYSDLNIQTIDKFNVRLIRSFIRDLDMSNDFEVLVDTDEFYQKVVDKFMDSVHAKDADQHKNKLVLGYIEMKLEEEQAWGLRDDLVETIKYFEKETFRLVLPKLLTYDFDFAKRTIIQQKLEGVEAQHEQFKCEILEPFLNAYDVEALKSEFARYDIKNTHHIYNFFKKERHAKFLDSKSFSPSNNDKLTEFAAAQTDGLVAKEILKIADYYWTTKVALKDLFLTYQFALKSFYPLALLQYLLVLVKQQKIAENKIPLNEINDLISTQMRMESADYIYERVGVRFDHYLLDEFQDTSRMQWLNLLPLVHNSMAGAFQNLIVGDSKQAIYRFRNGVVEQFAELPVVFNPEGIETLGVLSDYFVENSANNTLNHNWRSRKTIVGFNNDLFSHLRNNLAEYYQTYYAEKDLVQKEVNQEPGYINIQLEIKENFDATGLSAEESTDEIDIEEICQEELFLLQTVRDVLARGYQMRDICVLTRGNKELNNFAKLLIAHHYEVTTDEGLLVSNSLKVRFVVAWLQLVLKPSSSQYQRNFALHLFLLRGGFKSEQDLAYFGSGFFDYPAFLNDHFQSEQIHSWSYENLYDLVLKMVKRVEIDELSDPFLHFFCNLVQSFDVSQGPNIEKFIYYYELKGHQKRVPLAEGNAIRLMTAHKSKGLEFPIVIMPNVNWSWSIKPFNKFLYHDEKRDVFYIKNISKAEDNSTQMQQELYDDEIERNKLDIFNLFYVACTRAVDELHMRVAYTPKKEEDKEVSLGYFVHSYLIDNTSIYDCSIDNMGLSSYRLGAPTHKISEPFKSSQLTLNLYGETLWFPDISLIDSDSIDKMELQKERWLGQVMHAVLESMQCSTDLSMALYEMATKYALNDQEIQEIEKSFQDLFADAALCAVIFPDITEKEITLDECEIVLSKDERMRPDRVIIGLEKIRVIEYKTGMPRQKDVKQLQNYVSALNRMPDMAAKVCSGYLVYTDSREVRQVI